MPALSCARTEGVEDKSLAVVGPEAINERRGGRGRGSTDMHFSGVREGEETEQNPSERRAKHTKQPYCPAAQTF